MTRRAILPYLAITAGATAVDYLVKRLVESRLEMHSIVDVMPFLALYRTHNTGIAFSMLDWLQGPWLVLMPIAIIALVVWLASRSRGDHIWARTGFALIIGGAIGNLIDRVSLGYVIDYILFYVGGWSFAIFNFADACISVGAALVVLQEFIDWRRRAGDAGQP